MKNKLYSLIFLSFLFFSNSFAQNGIVNYGFIEALFTGNAVGEDCNAVLKFNKNNIAYVSNKTSLEKPEDINVKKTFERPDDSGGVISMGMQVTPNGNQVLIDKKQNILLSNDNPIPMSKFFLKEEIPTFDWKINNKETKKIGKFDCTKATTTFRGRNYTAWFAKTIPVPYGPWKLGGLPGLILEAYDTNKNVYWYFKSIEYPAPNVQVETKIFNEKMEGQKQFINLKEYAKKQAEYIKEQNERSIMVAKKFNMKMKETTIQENFIEIL